MILVANRRLRITLLMPEWIKETNMSLAIWGSPRMYNQGCKMAEANDGEICVRKPCRTKIIYSVAPTPDFQMRKAHHRSKSIKDFTRKILNTFYFRNSKSSQEKQGNQSSSNWHKTAAKQNGFLFVFLQLCHREFPLYGPALDRRTFNCFTQKIKGQTREKKTRRKLQSPFIWTHKIHCLHSKCFSKFCWVASSLSPGVLWFSLPRKAWKQDLVVRALSRFLPSPWKKKTRTCYAW